MSTESVIFICDFCQKIFSTRGNLNRHKKKHDTDGNGKGKDQDETIIICYPFDETIFKCFDGCEISFRCNNDLRNHLSWVHNFEIDENHLEFESLVDFQSWLEILEKDSNVRYCKTQGSRTIAEGSIEKFVLTCSRSGKSRLISNESRKRKCRSQGSSKLNSSCTSQMIVTRDLSSDKCVVVYFSTHYGHGEDIEYLRVSKHCRKEVAEQLSMGVPDTHVLQCLIEEKTAELSRDNILTKKDIRNIKKSIPVNVEEDCGSSDDDTEVDLNHVEQEIVIDIHDLENNDSENVQLRHLVNDDTNDKIQFELLKLQENLSSLTYSKKEMECIYKILVKFNQMGSKVDTRRTIE